MKPLFEQYAAYNLWANQQMTNAFLALPEEILEKNVKSSFSSIKLTLLHMWNTDSTWWQRVNQVENPVAAGNTSNTTQEIAEGLLAQSTQWHNWIEKSTSDTLEQEVIYRNSKKQQFKQPLYEILLHLFNHATYHRGQMVNILRQLHINTIPSTDFIIFSRSK